MAIDSRRSCGSNGPGLSASGLWLHYEHAVAVSNIIDLAPGAILDALAALKPVEERRALLSSGPLSHTRVCSGRLRLLELTSVCATFDEFLMLVFVLVFDLVLELALVFVLELKLDLELALAADPTDRPTRSAIVVLDLVLVLVLVLALVLVLVLVLARGVIMANHR